MAGRGAKRFTPCLCTVRGTTIQLCNLKELLLKVEGVDIKVQIDLGPGPVSFVTVSVHLEDTIDEFHGNWEISQKIAFNTNDPAELDRLLENHPLYLIGNCESPAEVWFYVFALEKLASLRPQVPIGPYRTDFGIPDKKIIDPNRDRLFSSFFGNFKGAARKGDVSL